MVFLISVPAKAQDELAGIISTTSDPYLIEKIEVDITAGSAVEAREQAFEAAQVKGYEALAKRLLSAEEYKEFETPDLNTISAFVQDYEVTNEKLSAVRYNGTYRIRFSENALSNIQQAANVIPDGNQQNMMPQGDILLIPIYQRGGRSFLWQANPFMQAWVRARQSGTTKNFIIPVGDIEDIRQFRDNQGLSYDPSRLNAMRLRYDAKTVALLTVEPRPQADSTTLYEIKLFEAQAYGPEPRQQMMVRAYPGELEEQLYNRLVNESYKLLNGIQTQMVNNQPQNNFNQADNSTIAYPAVDVTIRSQVNFSSVREWVQTKQQIEALPMVSNVMVKSMSPRAATLDIKFKGGEEELRQALSQKGLILNNAPQGQIYQIMRGQKLNSSVYAPTKIEPSAGYQARF
jgi:Fe-S cluster biosynthesis and repair protein YggX